MKTHQLGNKEPEKHKKSLNNWLLISSSQIVLSGILLTANFNIENHHEHLSVKFQIKSYLQGKCIPFLQIFPQKGHIMRGQIKKFRVKFAQQFKPEINDNGSMMLKILFSLNTQWNKQYMLTNNLRGWSEIKTSPIESYQIPIIISDQYFDIKQNIRNSALFESQFGKASQDISSLHGDENFQLPERNLVCNNLIRSSQKFKYSELQSFYDKRRLNSSQLKGSKSSITTGNNKNAGFDYQSNIIQSRVQHESSVKIPRRNSTKKQYQKDSSIVKRYQPASDFNQSYRIKMSPSMRKLFQNQQKAQRKFGKEKINQNSRKELYESGLNFEDSSLSILKSLEPNNSSIHQYDTKIAKRIQDYSDFKKYSHSKDYQTVKNHSQTGTLNTSNSNQRSMELIILAIIAGFFVALGSNLGSIFF